VISDVIMWWVEEKIAGGRAMLHMLADKGITTRFTVMSSTSQPVYGGRGQIAPRPRRVLDPFFWVLEYYRHLGTQDIVQASLNTIAATFSPFLRSVGPLILLLLLFIGLLCGGIDAFAISGGSSQFVIFCLSFILLFACTLFNQWIDEKNILAHSALNLTRLILFPTCLVLPTQPSVQQVLFRLTFSQLLGIFIVGTALFACFQPPARTATQSRISLATLAGIGALLQYAYGGGQELASLSFLSISPDAYVSTNTVLVWILAITAVVVLLLSKQERNWLDWLILFVVALFYAAFQYVYGSQEILQILPSANYYLPPFVTIDDVNIAIALMIAVVLPLAIFFLHRFPHVNCLPLLVLSFMGTGMINFLYNGAVLSNGSTGASLMIDSIGDFFMSNWIIEYALIAASILMIRRWLTSRLSYFTFWDYVVVFLSAFASAQIQILFWERSASQGNVFEFPGVLFIISQGVAYSLSVLVFSGLAIAFIVLLLPLFRQFKAIEEMCSMFNRHASWLAHIPFWHTRMMFIATTISCVMLEALYLPEGPIFSQTFPGGDVAALLVVIYFAFLALIALHRWRVSFTRGDRLLLLMNIIFCAAFYFVRINALAAPSLVFSGWNEDVYYLQIPDVLFVLLIVWGAFIMFWWSARCKFSGDHRLLQIVAVLALIGGLLQLCIPSLFFTLLALLSLIMGSIVTTISAWPSVLNNKSA
jgi:hypothetical protein